MYIFLLVLGGIGFCISLYGFFIEQTLKTKPNYKPFCDISDKASCTKPITSPMSKLFGISNTVLGMFFYAAIMVFTVLQLYTLILIGSIAACFVSLYLAYILFFHIKTFCLICIATYLINGALLLASLKTVF